MICNNCIHFNVCKHKRDSVYECEHFKNGTIKNQYDRIRNMSVEEMAKFIPDWSYTKACKCDEEIYADCNNECWKCVKEYLESEVDTE